MSIKLWNAETQTADNLIGSQIENNIIDDTTASTDKVYSSSKVESTVEGCYDHKIKSFTDLNLAIPSSTERIIHFTTFYQPSNRPNTVSNYFNGFSIRDRLTNKYVTQMVLSLDEKAYIRTRLGDNWGDWKQLATTDDVIVSKVIEHSYTLSANSTYTKVGIDASKDGYTLILAVCEATGGNEAYCYNCMISGDNLLNLQFKNTTSSNLNLTARIRCLYRKN